MNLHARVAGLIVGSARGRRSLDDDALALNFSFVLHDASSNLAVRRAVAAAQRHSRQRVRETRVVLDGDSALEVHAWLSATIGTHEHLADALTDAGLQADTVCAVDSGENPLQEATFFRSVAALTLPTSQFGRVGVAALIVRPGGHSRQLIVRGPFDWPSEQYDALTTLEAIIQAHVDQWTPQPRLWPFPFEVAFPDEVEILA